MTPPDKKTRKILCLRKDWYEELRALIKSQFVKRKRGKIESRRNKKEIKVFINKKEEHYRRYEASNIWFTRESAYWKWKRAKEWFNKYIKEKDERRNEKELRMIGVI